MIKFYINNKIVSLEKYNVYKFFLTLPKDFKIEIDSENKELLIGLCKFIKSVRRFY
jgi:hypothetical protein